MQIEETGFTPQVLIASEQRDRSIESAGISPAFFSLKGGDDPKISSNYIFENDAGRKAHLVISTQNIETPTETVQFKIAQIHFTNSDTTYSIIHINLAEWFRYEINAFDSVVKNFDVMIDGKMQNIEFGQHPVFRQLIADSRLKSEPEALPPARVGVFNSYSYIWF